jgi:hypothetical protein
VTVGVKVPPIYLIELPGTAWQLLWWLICVMDESQTVAGAWRTRAARELGRDRAWVHQCSEALAKANLITVNASPRWVKVETGNITG